MTAPLRFAWLYVLLVVISGTSAHADGGRLRFSKTAGPFLITLFTTPEPLTPGPADFSVMVQDAVTGQILPDAVVTLQLDEQDGRTIRAIADHHRATNQLMQAAALSLPSVGSFRLHLVVRDASREASTDSSLIVQPGSRTAPLIWTFALLPFLAVLLFALQQRQKFKLSQSR